MAPVFFFNDTASPEIYTYGHTLSLHDALPISVARSQAAACGQFAAVAGAGARARRQAARRAAALRTGRSAECEGAGRRDGARGGLSARYLAGAYGRRDRKSTRLNSSH